MLYKMPVQSLLVPPILPESSIILSSSAAHRAFLISRFIYGVHLISEVILSVLDSESIKKHDSLI